MLMNIDYDYYFISHLLKASPTTTYDVAPINTTIYTPVPSHNNGPHSVHPLAATDLPTLDPFLGSESWFGPAVMPLLPQGYQFPDLMATAQDGQIQACEPAPGIRGRRLRDSGYSPQFHPDAAHGRQVSSSSSQSYDQSDDSFPQATDFRGYRQPQQPDAQPVEDFLEPFPEPTFYQPGPEMTGEQYFSQFINHLLALQPTYNLGNHYS